MSISTSAYEKQQETITLLNALGEEYGLATGFNYAGLIKLSQDSRIDLEPIVRMLGGLQGADPEETKKIRYLYAIKLGTVKVKVPKSVLDQKELIPPKMPPELGLKESAEITYIDGLRDRKSGLIYFPINHRDILTEYILPSEYDNGMDEIREEINTHVTEFLRYKNKSFMLYEADGISFDTRLGSEVPPFRTYQMELIDGETEEVRYKLIYGQGKLLYKKGNLPFDRLVNTLKRIGRWEH